MAWNLPSLFSAGPLTSSKMNQIRDCLVALGTGTSYTPTLTNMTGSASAKYFEQGKWIVVPFTITFSGAATGSVTMSLPFTAARSSASNPDLGGVTLKDASVGTLRSARVLLVSTTTVSFVYEQTNTAATVGSGSTPWTWASSDTIDGTLEFEAA